MAQWMLGLLLPGIVPMETIASTMMEKNPMASAKATSAIALLSGPWVSIFALHRVIG